MPNPQRVRKMFGHVHWFPPVQAEFVQVSAFDLRQSTATIRWGPFPVCRPASASGPQLATDVTSAQWPQRVRRVVHGHRACLGVGNPASLVSVVSAMHGAGGSQAVALQAQGDTLVHTYEWAFEWGPGLVAGIGNGLLLGYLMYRSALVPPRLALVGLVGGPILILSFLMFLTGSTRTAKAHPAS
jgi:hypothetical protein